MNAQDQKKASPAGHESHGVHLCHKCGWPFPNPHPSAKHRRAHKRVCGTVEGHKLLESDSGRLHVVVSDDEHFSDDDRRTPSPKIDKEADKEVGSSGIVLRSTRAEDEVFSDAVMDFSDNGVSPSPDECLGSGKHVDAIVKGALAIDLSESALSKDEEASGKTEPPQAQFQTEPANALVTETVMVSSEVVGTVMSLSQTTEPINGSTIPGVSNASIGESGRTSEAVAVMDEQGTMKELMSSVNVDTENEVKRGASEVSLQGLKLEETEDRSSEPTNLQFTVPDPEGNLEGPLSMFKSDLVEASNGGPVLEDIEEDKNELMEKSETEISKHEILTQTGSPSVSSGFEAVNVEADLSLESASGNTAQVAGISDLKEEGNEDARLSLSETLPAIQKPEIFAGEFKDYKVFKSSIPLDLGDAEVVMPVDCKNKANEAEESQRMLSSDLGTLSKSSSNFDDKGDEIQKKAVLSTVEEEIDNSDVQSTHVEVVGDHASETPVDTCGYHHGNQTDGSYEGIRPYSVDQKALKHGDTELMEGEDSNVIPALPSSKDENSQKGCTDGDAGADVNVVAKVLSVGKENEKIPAEPEHSAKATATFVDAESSAETEAYRSVHSIVEGHFHGPKKDVRPEENICEETSEPGPGGNSVDRSNSNHASAEQQLPHSSESGIVIDSDQANISARLLENVAGLSTSCISSDKGLPVIDKDVLTSSQSPFLVVELDQNDHTETSSKNLPNLSPQEAPTFAVDSELSHQNASTVEDQNMKDAMKSVPVTDEGDGCKKLNVAPLETSFVSSSRTDSLEGNWGSVSVLSNQSDVAAIGETEVLASTDSLSVEKSEDNLQYAAKETHLHKSDDFEPPSFATLVQSGMHDDKKAAATSEIRMDQKVEQPKAEPLKAGWFPSITNVVNESEGRKKNEEIIAKVTNWSAGKQHSPLKSLLNEAQAEMNPRQTNEPKQVSAMDQAVEPALKSNGAAATTVSSILGSEMAGDDGGKKEMEKEWNSPARYPSGIKREKRKGKPYWVPFVCCSSMH